MDYSLTYVPVDEDIRVDAAVSCGKSFEGVAWILRYQSQNPALQIQSGLGFPLVKKIIEKAEDGF